MFTPSMTTQNVIGWIVTILVPFLLILTGVRVLLTPTFVNLEYRTPGFPEDPYGFTFDERMKWSLISLEYLLNDAGVEFLEELKFEDDTPIYNSRELKHLVDVKNVVKSVLNVWLISLVVFTTFVLWAWQGGWLNSFQVGLIRGAWVTIGFVVAVIIFVLIGFGVFFVFFHNVFFDPGTWTFLYSDTLIRLFPERFWRYCFIVVGLLSIIEAFGILLTIGKQ